MIDKPKWDLEEVPFHQFPNETNDPGGGWYLHFDTEADHEVLYMSKSHVSEEQAKLIAAAPELLEALKALASTARTFSDCVPNKDKMWTSIDEDALTAAFKAIAKATGEENER